MIQYEKKNGGIVKIYTREGDNGDTVLFGGTKIQKDCTAVWAYGTIDETNSILGLARAMQKNEKTKNIILNIQKKLLVIGAWLGSDQKGSTLLKEKIEQKDIEDLERIIDDFSKEFEQAKDFVIPGETIQSSVLHMARTTARKAERYTYALSKDSQVSPLILAYLNRLSDLLFVLANSDTE